MLSPARGKGVFHIMKITCSKSDLLSSVSIVMKAVSNKTTLPILECILIEVQDQIKLTATDMELGIETYVNGTILKTGKIAIDAKLFSEIIRKLPDSEIVIETDANYQALIKCEKAKFTIAGKSGDDFSLLPGVERTRGICLSQFTVKEVIRQTIFSTVENESTKLMSGELFEIEGNNLKVVSLDGHRISIRNVALKEQHDLIKVVVPGKTLNDVSKILDGGVEDFVDIYFTDKHILFEFGVTKVVSRLLEGEYYKINQMLTNDYETKVKINKKEFLDCIDRATLLIKESDKKPIILNINSGTIHLKIDSSIGSMNEEMDIQKEGKDLIIGFNPKLLLDALRVIEEEEINVYFMNQKAPCYIKDEEETYRYVVLPVNISNANV